MRVVWAQTESVAYSWADKRRTITAFALPMASMMDTNIECMGFLLGTAGQWPKMTCRLGQALAKWHGAGARRRTTSGLQTAGVLFRLRQR